MGKRWSRKRKKEESIRKAAKPRQDRDPQESPANNNELHGYRCTNPSNAKMEAYYAYQGLHNLRHRTSPAEGDSTFVPCTTDGEKEEERKKFMETMRRILPVSFRIGQNIEEELRLELVRQLDEFVGKEIEILVSADGKNFNKKTAARNADADPDAKEKNGDEVIMEDTKTNSDAGKNANGKGDAAPSVADTTTATSETTDPNPTPTPTMIKKVAPAKNIPYIPNAYQLSVDRRTLRRNPKLEEFHDWLKIQTEAGFITRQETVSMIPPIVLSAEPHHHIMDMCAAPGSKTSQLLEIVGNTPSSQSEPIGFVVANDSDAKRAYMLVHQLRRLNNPAAFLTCVDAQFWPTNFLRGPDITTDASRAQEGIFDRVLCDVPCSGDGTARKNPGVWRHWGPLGALGLHPLQLSIVLNGARLTKVGGYVCYSTCSMNPIENEAVVAELLRLANGGLELVDRREGGVIDGNGNTVSMMKGFEAREGWTHWKVMSEDKRRKDLKNEMKKRNKEMKKRKMEWEEKNQIREKKIANGNGHVDGEDGGEDGTEGVREWADEVKRIKAERISQKEEREPWVASPPSWDEEALLKRAEATGMNLYRTFEDVPETQRRRCRESCFAPTKDEIAKFNLHRCMRCLPHDLDTGGFFVALFRKIAPLSERAKRKAEALALDSRPDAKKDKEEMEAVETDTAPTKDNDNTGDKADVKAEEKADDKADNKADEKANDKADDKADNKADDKADIDNKAATNANNAKGKLVYGKPLLRGRGKVQRNQGLYDFVALEGDILPPLIEFYGLSDSFAREQFMARNEGNAKILYFITASVKKNLLDRGVQDKVSVVTSGLRAFERNSRDGVILYRPCQECIHFVAPHMSKRKIIANLVDFKNCLNTGCIKVESFSESMAEQIKSFSTGAFVVALKGFETNVAKKMFLVMWRCRGDNGNSNCLVAKMEQEGIKSKLKAFGDDDEKVGKNVESTAPVETKIDMSNA